MYVDDAYIFNEKKELYEGQFVYGEGRELAA
jgi:hypothetical protein